MKRENTSAAVMQQRREARDALDDFPTPMWATRALCKWLEERGHWLSEEIAREPCANRGYMVVPLQEYFAEVSAADVHDYGVGYPVEDYLFDPLPEHTNWTVMNPPFRLAQQFIERALATSDSGVAVFVRSAFLESVARYEDLFSRRPHTAILQFSERVCIHKGVMRRKGEKYLDNNGVERTAATATAYCWIVWEARWYAEDQHTEFHWIPPSKEQLERPGDYDVRGSDAA